MSVQDPYLVNVDLDVHLRDARHAHRLFTEHSFALAPKTKFLYHVVFQPFANAAGLGDKTTSNTLKFQKEIGVLAKSVDLPQYRASVDNKQQYNRKKNIQTRIDYQDVTIRFHDDNNGLTRSMLEEYYRYYFRDGNNDPTKGSFNPRDKYSTTVPKYGLDNNTLIPFFSNIKIYQLARRNWFSYTLINPLITQWGHDTLESADGAGMMENSIVIAYEGVLYDHGEIKDETPPGFTDEETRYDNAPSPLGYWSEELATRQAEPTLLTPKSSTPQGLLPRMSNGQRVVPRSEVGVVRELPGALPAYLIPTQDTQNTTVSSTVETYTGRISNADGLINELNNNPSANKSFVARSLNSGFIEGLNYSGYNSLDTNSKNAVDRDLQTSIQQGNKKLQSFAQDAINQSKDF
jgi:hypothetical protein